MYDVQRDRGELTLPREVAAGGSAGALQIVVTTPMELLKVQLQDAGRVGALFFFSLLLFHFFFLLFRYLFSFRFSFSLPVLIIFFHLLFDLVLYSYVRTILDDRYTFTCSALYL